MAEIVKAKPCPFCGSNDLTWNDSSFYFPYWVTCDDCGACGPEKETFNQALEAWNARPDAQTRMVNND